MKYSVNFEKMEQAIKYLKAEEIDLWLIITSEGSDPCLPLVTGVKTVGPGAFVISKSGEKLALCSSIDAQDIEESGLFDEVYKYTTSLAEPLKRVVKEFNPAKIAINYSEDEHLADGLTVGRYRWLRETIKEVFKGEFVSSQCFLSSLRSIKTDREVDTIYRAIRLTQEIYSSIFNKLRVGMTEKQVGQLFVDEMEKHNVVNGIDRTLSMPIVLKERIAHRSPSDAIIEPGDLLIMDFSLEIDGYVSDIARTVYFLKLGEEEAPKHITQAFNTIYDAISKAAEKLKPGVIGCEVDGIARSHLTENGYPEITHATGHQIGRDVHDGGVLLGPKWARYGNSPYGKVEEGMVFTLEPTLFTESGLQFIVEENVLVTQDGAEFLTERQSELILIRS